MQKEVYKKKFVEEDEEEEKVFFSSAGNIELLNRIFFCTYYRILSPFLTKNDLGILVRSLFLIFILFSLSIFLLSFYPKDYYKLKHTPRYDKPSEIYALDKEGDPILITEFYSQARRVIKLEEKNLNHNRPHSLSSTRKKLDEQNDKIKMDMKRENLIKDGMQSKVVKTFIATEDARFLFHPGVDLLGIVRAFWVNLMAGRVKEGGSTITQQVARLRFLSRERSYLRKLREAFLAVLLELAYTKKEIIEDYLNMVPLGHGTNGVEAASHFYFNKSINEMSWGEVALLASLTTRPREFSPFVYPRNSMDKVKLTLLKMIENGGISIAQAEEEFQNLKENYYAVINRSPNDSAYNQRLNLYPYVTAFVRSQLPKELNSTRVLSTAGLRIYTTIRHKHQEAVAKKMPKYLKRLTAQRWKKPFKNYKIFDTNFEGFYPMSHYLFDIPEFTHKMTKAKRDFYQELNSKFLTEFSFLSLFVGDTNIGNALDHYILNRNSLHTQQIVEGGLVSILPYTGEISAVFGGSGFSPNNQQLRFVKIRRQPGSAFKPIIVASALEASFRGDTKKKLNVATVFEDTPLHFINRDLSEYAPQNFSASYEGPIRLRKALTLSKNTVTIQLYRRFQAEWINPIAETLLQLDRLKPPQILPQDATVALGSYGLSPLQMAQAYAVFASSGQEVLPYVIERIVDTEGNILYERKKNKDVRQILNESTVELMVSMLRDVVEKGTGQGARLLGRKVAGKTGTTNLSTDAWFIGFTPQLVTAVYIGYDKPQSLGGNSTGGSLAAPLWAEYMYEALKGVPPKSYNFANSELQELEICESTGVLPGIDCEERIKEWFAPGTEPKEIKRVFSDSFRKYQNNEEETLVESKDADSTLKTLNDDDFDF